MTTRFHTLIALTTIAAALASGISSASFDPIAVAPKEDKLPVLARSAADFVTIERRGPGVSILSRVVRAQPPAAAIEMEKP